MISADLVPNLDGPTRAMLEKAGLASAENWIFSDGFVERLRFEIDPAWQGDIPRTLLVARDGTVITIEGSAYRRPGAKLLVAESGATLGSISGGTKRKW